MRKLIYILYVRSVSVFLKKALLKFTGSTKVALAFNFFTLHFSLPLGPLIFDCQDDDFYFQIVYEMLPGMFYYDATT